MHTVGGQVESQSPGLRVQFDNDALVVLEIGDRATLNYRQSGCDCRIIATEIRRTDQIVDFTLSGNPGAADVNN